MPGLSGYGVTLDSATLLTIGSQETLGSMATGATGRPLWPSDLTGLVLWLQADQIQGIASGASLSAWTDSSASLAHATQASAVSQPIFLTNQRNGLSAVSFGGAVSQFMTSNLSIGDAMVLAGALLPSKTTPGQRWIGGVTSPRLDVTASVGSIIYTRGTNFFVTAQPATQWISLFGYANPLTSSGTISLNGIVTAGSATTSGTTSLTCQIGAVTASSGTIGALMGEILVYDRNINESERSSLDSYLRSKWAI